MEEDFLNIWNTDDKNRSYIHYDYIKNLVGTLVKIDDTDLFMALLIKEYFLSSECKLLKTEDLNAMYDKAYLIYAKDTKGTLLNPAYLEEVKDTIKSIKDRIKGDEDDD